VLLGPFIPMLFQGEEWNAVSPFQYFADHKDRELAKQVSEGRKREFIAFGWDPAIIPDPESRDTFLRSKLNWDELPQPDHADMLSWYRKLIELRHSMPCLNNGEPGNTAVAYSEEQKWIRMTRGSIVVACNLNADPQSIPIDGNAELMFASRQDVAVEEGKISLSPDYVAILRIEAID